MPIGGINKSYFSKMDGTASFGIVAIAVIALSVFAAADGAETFHPGITAPENPFNYNVDLVILSYQCPDAPGGTCVEGDRIIYTVHADGFSPSFDWEKIPDPTSSVGYRQELVCKGMSFDTFIKDAATGAPVSGEVAVDTAEWNDKLFTDTFNCGRKNYTITATVPGPSSGNTVYLTPCFKYYTGATNPPGVSCEAPSISLQVVPLAQVACRSDSSCASDEICQNFKCVAKVAEPSTQLNQPLRSPDQGLATTPLTSDNTALFVILGLVIVIGIGVAVYILTLRQPTEGKKPIKKTVEKPKPEVIFCKKCGTKNTKGDKFCRKCRAKL